MSDLIKRKLGEQAAMVMCQFNSMADILAHAFGGKKPKGKDVTEGAKTAEQAISNINALLTFG